MNARPLVEVLVYLNPPGEAAKPVAVYKAALPKANGHAVNGDASKKIKVLAKRNPRHGGSPGYKNWRIIEKHHGKTVQQYLDAGGNMGNLRADIKRGNARLYWPRRKRSAK